MADLSKYKDILQNHRDQLNQWISKTKDPGPETLETYILETEDQMSRPETRFREKIIAEILTSISSGLEMEND